MFSGMASLSSLVSLFSLPGFEGIKRSYKKESIRFWGMDDVTIEDLAFEVRSSREADEVSRPRCLSTRQEKEASPVMKKRA